MRMNGDDGNGWREGDPGQRDSFVGEALTGLDPAARDPMYWFRFHRGVMQAAVAAALAGFLLFQGPESLSTVAEVPVGIEELLMEGLEGTPIPAVLGGSTPEGPVTFASDAY